MLLPRLLTAIIAIFAVLGAVGELRAAQAATNFQVTGRGWGHGAGMSQYGALGMSQAGKGYDEILTHYYSGTQIESGTLPEKVRIGVGERVSWGTIRSTGQFTVFDAKLRPIPRHTGTEGSYTFSTSKDGFIQLVKDGAVVAKDRTFTFKPRPGSEPLAYLDNRAYRRYLGDIQLVQAAGRKRINVINVIDPEEYLKGLGEMPDSWGKDEKGGTEALKAQVVAARNYLKANLGKHRKDGFDLCATPRCQVYYGYWYQMLSSPGRGNVGSSSRPHLAVAVEGTNGRLLIYRGDDPRYQGRVIRAYYHSTSGGRTEDNENVWSGKALPWLRSVPDPYDRVSPLHAWPENPLVFSAAYVQQRFGRFGPGNPTGIKGHLHDMVVVGRGTSPRVQRVALVGSEGTTYVSGSKVRLRLRLRDNWFTIGKADLNVAPSSITLGAQSAGLAGQITPVPAEQDVVLWVRSIDTSAWSTYDLKTDAKGKFGTRVAPDKDSLYKVTAEGVSTPEVRLRVTGPSKLQPAAEPGAEPSSPVQAASTP